MKFTCLQENLKNGLNIVEKITGKNFSLPILSTVLIEVKNNLIKLNSTDLEIGISCWITGKIEKEGSICVPAKIFNNYVNSLPNKKIELEYKENKLNLKCENYKSSIIGLNPEDFPIIPQIKEKEFVILNPQKFCQGLSRVVGVTALSETKPEISGVFIKFQKDFIKLVATDSFRLAEHTLAGEKLIDLERSIIVPAKTIQEVIRIFGQQEQDKSDLEIRLSQNQILFAKDNQRELSSFPKIQLISRLIEGEYPDYEEIIPKDCLTRILLSREEISRHLKIASLFASRIYDIKIKANQSKKTVEFFSSDSDAGENKSEIPAKIEGEEVEVTFNWKYLMDGLAGIQTDQVVFELNDEGRPGVLKPLDTKDFLYIVMPIKSS